MISIKSNVAVTSVACTLFHWLGELETHLKEKISRETILDSIPLLKSATGFIADASAESIRFAAKDIALTNSVRRALWVKQWGGDVKSGRRLGELQALSCREPFLRILDDRLILKPDSLFIPKINSSFHRNQEIVLPSFCNNPKNSKESGTVLM